MKKLCIVLVSIFCTSIVGEAQLKIAHVNIEMLHEILPSRKKEMDKINAFEASSLAEIKRMQEDFDKTLQDYQEGIKKNSFTPTVLKYYENQIEKKEKEITERNTELKNQYSEMSNQATKLIEQIMKNAVATIANAKGLDYVLDVNATVFAKGTDITKEVMAEILRIDK